MDISCFKSRFLTCFIMFSFVSFSLKTELALGSETDRLALLALKDQLVGGVPEVLSSWNDSLHFCRWQGVGCSHKHPGRVIAVMLNSLKLSGFISPSIGNLTFLREVTLSDNSLKGNIPREFGRLRWLRYLSLTRNNLQGNIPEELTNCSNLKVINLRRNNLTGYIPYQFGSMLQLTMLALGKNSLTGAIPPSFVNLSSLNYLSLGDNHLEGGIPHDVGKMSNLTIFYLGGNNLSGDLPPSIYNLSYINNLDIGGNHISGSLIAEIDLAFPNLQILAFGANQFRGTIPNSISNISGLQYFDITENGFVGSVPNNLGKLSNLRELTIGLNNFGSGQTGDLDFLSSLSNCSQLNMLDMQMNRFGGMLPDSIGNLSTQLRVLDMGRNLISGHIPEGIGNLVGLIEIGMEINSLTGTIPVSLGKLQNLGRLLLNRNQLSGEIPSFIGNLSKIFDLYLHTNRFVGRIPLSLMNLRNMQYLLLSRNKLSGSIPDQLFGFLKNLILLHLSENFLTGPLPPDFGKLKNLNELYVRENKLSGKIPLELSECSTLKILDMEGNLFQGSIPVSFGSLRSLEILDLSHNNLSGVIPRELEKLPFLSNLNLSFNYLDGEVPKDGVFNNTSGLSINGNKKLCGGIPELHLPECSILKPKRKKISLSTKAIVVLIVGILLSLFLVATLVILYRRRQPRRGQTSVNLSGDGYLQISYKELLRATDDFASSNLVGVGSFGSVYKGFLHRQEKAVAVKVLDLKKCGAAKSFLAECKALSRVRHRNLLKIVTCCSTLDYKGNDFKALVFEFMPNGSLDSWLHEGSESRNLSFLQRLTIALDVANALEYLHHHCETPVVHRDLKPTNVLLDEDMVAHLGDFGLAKFLFGVSSNIGIDQTNSSALKGTVGYIAPEYGMGGMVSSEGDIYGYGILLLEMITGRRPTDSLFEDGVSLHDFVKMSLLEHLKEIIDSCLLKEFSEAIHTIRNQQSVEEEVWQCLVSFAQVGVACSSEVPNERMKITDAITELLATKSRLLRTGICGQGQM